MSEAKVRKSGLTTLDLHALDRAVRTILPPDFRRCTYLVGTAQTGGEYRDVDVRTMLADEDFDAIFGTRIDLWESYCFAVAAWLKTATGLPIDYQVQRRTQANEKYSTPGGRNPLGLERTVRRFAGGGDATAFTHPEET